MPALKEPARECSDRLCKKGLRAADQHKKRHGRLGRVKQGRSTDTRGMVSYNCTAGCMQGVGIVSATLTFLQKDRREM